MDLTRREFLTSTARAAAAMAGLGAVAAACGSSAPQATGSAATPTPSPASSNSPSTQGAPSASPSQSPSAGGPLVLPAPVSVRYGDLLAVSALDLSGVSSLAIAALAREVASQARIADAPAPSASPSAARLTVDASDATLPAQAYSLVISPGATGGSAQIALRASDEAGAWNGLLSLGQLVVSGQGGTFIRAAQVSDAPGFLRRGPILDPYVLPDVGVTADSKARLMSRLRFAVRYKANFVDLPGRVPWPELVSYCRDHHVELMVGLGYKNWIVELGTAEWRRRIGEVMDAGARSIALDFDDVPVDDGASLATAHAAAFVDLYGYIRGRDPDCRISAVLSPYGGIPGAPTFGRHPQEGVRYLAVMKDALPDDVRVFWTGDGGVYSPTVTAAGAQAYREAIGRELAFWDNDAIRFSRDRLPCRGRAPDLASVVPTFMSNLAGEQLWHGTNGEFAMLTSLIYAWNPTSYTPDEAAASAERVLGGLAAAGRGT